MATADDEDVDWIFDFVMEVPSLSASRVLPALAARALTHPLSAPS